MKTNDRRLSPGDMRYAKRGGQPGNRNAFKTGAYTASMRAWRSWGRDWRKRVKAALAQAEAELRDRQHLLPPESPVPSGRLAGKPPSPAEGFPSHMSKMLILQWLPVDGPAFL